MLTITDTAVRDSLVRSLVVHPDNAVDRGALAGWLRENGKAEEALLLAGAVRLLLAAGWLHSYSERSLGVSRMTRLAVVPPDVLPPACAVCRKVEATALYQRGTEWFCPICDWQMGREEGKR